MGKIAHFVKEWSGGFVFWLYTVCILYVAGIANEEQWQGMAIFNNPVVVFLLISGGALLIWSLFECGDALAKEIPKELEKIHKELDDGN